MSDIHIILTGGTIAKRYDPLTEKPELHSKAITPHYLETIIKVHPDIKYETIALIDSTEMTEEVREKIIHSVKKSDAKSIVIVHGTSTMEETAQYINEKLPPNDKAVILTGAMIPLKEFAMSDGGFNLGYAIAQAQNAVAGVYVAMNAHLFKAGEVTKNTDIGRFECNLEQVK